MPRRVEHNRDVKRSKILCGRSSFKHLLKDQLLGWPDWFLERRKLGFAYNLRWHWALTRFGGLREMISKNAIEIFADRIPRELRGSPSQWNTRDVFHHFSAAWRLMVWSAFTDRLADATRANLVVPRNSPVAITGGGRPAVTA